MTHLWVVDEGWNPIIYAKRNFYVGSCTLRCLSFRCSLLPSLLLLRLLLRSEISLGPQKRYTIPDRRGKNQEVARHTPTTRHGGAPCFPHLAQKRRLNVLGAVDVAAMRVCGAPLCELCFRFALLTSVASSGRLRSSPCSSSGSSSSAAGPASWTCSGRGRDPP